MSWIGAGEGGVAVAVANSLPFGGGFRGCESPYKRVLFLVVSVSQCLSWDPTPGFSKSGRLLRPVAGEVAMCPPPQ